MKLICIDNFARDTVPDTLVAKDLTPFWAERLVNAMNTKYSGDNHEWFFRAVDDNYILFEVDLP